jgi:arylsulfatase A-like enzyme
VAPTAQPVTDENFYTTDAFAARAADWIGQHQDAPWFLYMPFNAVHAPHEATEKYLKRFAHISDPRRRQFDGMLSAMDDAVGLVLGKLRELKLEERTLVFFISDNGAPGGRDGNGVLRGGKHTCWEGGFRLPWLMQWKGQLPAGKVEDRPVVQLDVLPTCIAAAGGTVDPAWKLDGVNLLPYLIGGNSERPHQTLYWRIDGMWAVRHGDLKLVHGEADNSPPELFDLAQDIGEKNNLASKQPDKAKELQTLWDQWNAQLAPPSTPKDKALRKEKKKQRRQQ